MGSVVLFSILSTSERISSQQMDVGEKDSLNVQKTFSTPSSSHVALSFLMGVLWFSGHFELLVISQREYIVSLLSVRSLKKLVNISFLTECISSLSLTSVSYTHLDVYRDSN